MALSLHVAAATDASSIGEISVRAWQEAYRGLLPDAYLDGLESEERARTWEGVLTSPPPMTKVILARQGERCVGFAASGPCLTEPDLGELYAINVQPDVWRRGAGTSLLRAATSHLRDAGFMDAVLWVLHGNATARRFYETQRWRADGVQRDQEVYGIVISELRYRLRLWPEDQADKLGLVANCAINTWAMANGHRGIAVGSDDAAKPASAD